MNKINTQKSCLFTENRRRLSGTGCRGPEGDHREPLTDTHSVKCSLFHIPPFAAIKRRDADFVVTSQLFGHVALERPLQPGRARPGQVVGPQKPCESDKIMQVL